jgi:hypothetical protein
VQRLEPAVAERLRVDEEQLVGGVDRRAALGRQLRADADAGADDGQRTARPRLRLRRQAP